MKTALITGVTGQDGAYLLDLLLAKGYIVHGIIRRSSSFNTARIDHVIDNKKYANRFIKHYGDLTDSNSLNRIVERVCPDEIYNLGAQSHVKVSFDIPDYTTQVDALGTLRFLEAIKKTGLETKFYQASTSELFGKVKETPQSEKTPFNPCSPYAISKQYAFWTIKNYREAYGLFAVNGILFNHESPLRGGTFVTKKITTAAAKIKLGYQKTLSMGNIDSKRDWGYAPEYVEAMWLMLQQDKPEDFVIATGETHTVREFIEKSFSYLEMPIEWSGEGENEKGIDKNTGRILITINPDYFRPTDVEFLLGDSSKAKKRLGWEPKVKFKELVKIMTKADFEFYKSQARIK